MILPDAPATQPLIWVLTACYNEEENVEVLYERVRAVFAKLDGYTYEHVFIDNASTDRTVAILREIAARDRNVKIIVNTRNFGHVRSPYHALLQCRAHAVIGLVADLQDPPELIPEFLAKWQQGYKVVLGVKTASQDSPLMSAIRRRYYGLLDRLSETRQVRNSTGFGLYDQSFIAVLRTLTDPYPYFRGIVSELGFQYATVLYTQPPRVRGTTKNNFYTLYDIGIAGIVNHSKIPLRLATMMGFCGGVLCLLGAVVYLVVKLLFWCNLPVGIAPLIITLFFLSSVQLFFLGILGEYIGSIYTQVRNRPLVVERERINFDDDNPTAKRQA